MEMEHVNTFKKDSEIAAPSVEVGKRTGRIKGKFFLPLEYMSRWKSRL